MSYDVWIGGKSFNYTSNTRMLIYDHIPEDTSRGGLHELEGKTGREAAMILGEAFERINSTRHKLYQPGVVGEPAMCAKYDSPSGWGSMVGTLIFMAQILAACAESPDEIVGLSA